MVGSVGEVANMKRRKLWKTGGGWAVSLQQCHPNSAGSLVIARRTEWNIVLLFLCVVGYPPNWGKRPRYIEYQELVPLSHENEKVSYLLNNDLPWNNPSSTTPIVEGRPSSLVQAGR